MTFRKSTRINILFPRDPIISAIHMIMGQERRKAYAGDQAKYKI